MAVVIREPSGVVLDHSAVQFLVSDSNTDSDHPNTCYKLKTQLFEVYTPFYMDSQANRIKTESQKELNSGDSEITAQETSAQRKRRKKKPPTLTTEESKVCQLVCRALPNLVKRAKESQFFLEGNDDFLHSHDNNKVYRLSDVNLGCGDKFQDLCVLSEEDVESTKGRKVVLDKDSLRTTCPWSLYVSTMVENPEATGRILTIDEDRFLIPASSRFLISSFSLLTSVLHQSLIVPDGYDLVVLDPPWTNKSVKRKKSYHTFDESELCSLPAALLCKPGGLVCMWVTNNERILSFVKDVLFPMWDVQWIAEWIWMKVTKCGEPVCDIYSSHKKPYERLMIGRVKDNHSKLPEPDTLCHNNSQNGQEPVLGSQSTERKETEGKDESDSDDLECKESRNEGQSPSIPTDYVLVSVPCSLHSKKPPLSEVLGPYLPSHPKCLEMFARNLFPGWTSWGNEVLRHQHSDYFDGSAA